jgi:predicted nucleic acid-binding protein
LSGYLADTSIFIAAERREELGAPPDGQSRISVVTLTELLVGVRAARSEVAKTVRERTLAKARSFVSLPFDEPVAEALAVLVHSAREQRRRAPLPDAIIAATALAHDLAVWTCDQDFESMAEIEPGLRVHPARPR